MEQEPMKVLPPKYLKPIFMTGKNTVIQRQAQTLPVKPFQEGEFQVSGTSFAGATESYSAGAEQYTAGAEFSAGAEFGAEQNSAGTESYAGAEQFSAGAEGFGAGADFSSFEQTTTTTTTTTESLGAGASGDLTGVKILRRGSGITLNEQNKIVSTAVSVRQQGLEPISNNTANMVKKVLGGDWLVIVYPKDKPIDFNMTCVQGNDYLYFTLDELAFQVCRLR